MGWLACQRRGFSSSTASLLQLLNLYYYSLINRIAIIIGTLWRMKWSDDDKVVKMMIKVMKIRVRWDKNHMCEGGF